VRPAHEAAVAERFDALEARFKPTVAADDFRLRALVRALDPVAGRRVLDLGCGKGRFAGWLAAQGAEVVGLDRSAAMLGQAGGLPRVLASARRLPFAAAGFDAVVAVEVLEHIHPAALAGVLAEVQRVLRPGGVLAVIDKNAASLNARRPWLPNLAVKWLDQRRGRWMYPAGGPVRERWLWPERFASTLGGLFGRVRVDYLLSPDEAGHRVFRAWPRARRFVLWKAEAPGGDRA
jgi:2-polyprenyl-6-hydroxyphenyl methylase/3-demethylubiquinone-9 3-methyltransferase